MLHARVGLEAYESVQGLPLSGSPLRVGISPFIRLEAFPDVSRVCSECRHPEGLNFPMNPRPKNSIKSDYKPSLSLAFTCACTANKTLRRPAGGALARLGQPYRRRAAASWHL